MQVSGLAFNSPKSKQNISFGINNSDNRKADKIDVAVGVASAVAYGGIVSYLTRNRSSKDYYTKPLTIVNSFFAGALGFIASNILRKKDSKN